MGSKTPLTDAAIARGNKALTLLRNLDIVTDHARRLESALALAVKVVRLSNEFCNAIDAEDADIGGCRPSGDILADLGPATDEAMCAIEKLKGGA